MTIFNYLPVTKQSQTHSKRQKLTQRMMGDISNDTRKKVNNRTLFAPIGCCERCKKNRNGYWTLELAHIDSRGSISHKTTEYDLVRLCGPSTNSDTCHYFAHTAEGKKWMYEFQTLLREKDAV